MNLRPWIKKIVKKKHNVRLKSPFFGKRFLGEGKSGRVTEEKLLTTWKERTSKKTVAVKKLHRYYGNWGLDGAEVAHEDIRSNLVHLKRVWRDLKEAGLPVAPQYTPILRKTSPHYLSLLMTQLERKHGKLIKGHETDDGRPILFRKLTIGKDKELIKDLAQDVAKIHNLGYDFPYPDIWAYYKKGNSYGRAIIDLDDLRKDGLTDAGRNRANLFDLISGEFLPNEYNYFIHEYNSARKNF